MHRRYKIRKLLGAEAQSPWGVVTCSGIRPLSYPRGATRAAWGGAGGLLVQFVRQE